MRRTETREIGGTTYSVTQLGWDDGQRLFFNLAKLAGPSVAALLREWQGAVGADGKPKLDSETVSAALTEFLQSLSYPMFRDFVDTFVKVTKVHGENDKTAPLADMKAIAFAGDYASLCRWLGFCLEVNYSSFFDGMGLTSRPAPAASASA